MVWPITHTVAPGGRLGADEPPARRPQARIKKYSGATPLTFEVRLFDPATRRSMRELAGERWAMSRA